MNHQLPQENEQEKNQSPTNLTFYERIRSYLALHLSELFNPPHLPNVLIIFAIGTIVTDAAITLISQPAHYWIDYGSATNITPVSIILKISPFLFTGMILLYIFLIAFILGVLNRRSALVAWMIISNLHLIDALKTTGCALNNIITLSGNACSIYKFGLAFLVTTAMGLVLSSALFVDTSKPQMPKTKWSAASLLIVWILILGFGVARAAMLPNKGWLPLVTKSSPKGRSGAAIAYDSKRNQAIMFGGSSAWLGNEYLNENDTWVWDGSDWSEVSSGENPSARSAHAMAYDEKRDVVVLFGGQNQKGALGDTWEFYDKQWHRLDLTVCTCSPPVRAYHQMFYDPSRGKVILYGGYDLDKTFYNDAWEWDGSHWSQIIFDTVTPPASGFNLVYDNERDQVLALLSGYPGGTWIWNDASWKRLELPLEPSNRTGAGAIFNPISKTILLYGGSHSDILQSDTWEFDGKKWKQLDVPSSLGAISGFSMFFDKTSNRVIIFGGYENGVYHNETWEFVYP